MHKDNWEEVILESVTSHISRGVTPSYSGEGITVINQKCIRDKKLSLELSRITDPVKKKVPKNKYLQNNDIVICSTGIGTLGRVAQVKGVNQKMTADSHVTIVRGNEKVDKSFLGWNLKGREREIELLAEGSTGQTELPRKKLSQLLVLLPPLPEQKAIAAVLSSLDDKIELLREQNKVLEETAQEIFREWFVRKEWETINLGDLVEVKRGGSPRPIQEYISRKGLRWLKISDASATNSPYIFQIKECIKEEGLKKTVLLKAHSLVLSNSATPGMPKILAVNSCIHDGWLYFPESKFSNEFLYLFFLQIRPQLIKQGSGSVFTNLKTDILKKYRVPHPNTDVLDKFDRLVKPMFRRIYMNTYQVETLSIIRDTLLPKLMKGEVNVKI